MVNPEIEEKMNNEYLVQSLFKDIQVLEVNLSFMILADGKNKKGSFVVQKVKPTYQPTKKSVAR
jgi:hypothetical protein